MTIYVDPIFGAMPQGTQAARHGNQWCHMLCDGNLNELHKMAEKIGLKRSYFQCSASVPHYDLTPSKRKLAVRSGAVEVTHEEFGPVRKEWIQKGREMMREYGKIDWNALEDWEIEAKILSGNLIQPQLF